MYIPFNYEQINLMAGTYSPSQVKSYNNKTFNYWVRSLFQRACSVLEFELPEDWNGEVRDFFLYVMYRLGYCVIFDDSSYGLSFQPCSLNGQNFYYGPVNFVIANPRLQKTGEIGKDGEILKLTPDYRGVWDIIEYYAEKLSMLDVAINTSLINSKLSLILGAKNKSAKAALQKALDKINEGQPAVIVDTLILDEEKTDPFQIFKQENLKNSYITTEQLKDFQTILNNFDAEIGIPTIPYEKKERMVTDEANSRQIDGMSRSVVWYDTLKSSIEKVKKLYPEITLDVKMRYKNDEEVKGEDEDE